MATDLPTSRPSNDDDRSLSGEKDTHDVAQLRELCNEFKKKINEKDKYISDTANESVEIVLNWYQRIINDLMESQSQILEDIQNERDRARDELAQFDVALSAIEQANALSHDTSSPARLNEWQTRLANYQLSKDIYLPESRIFQPRYKIVYDFKTSPQAEEDWDVESNEVITIPLPSHLTFNSIRSTVPATTMESPAFFPDASLPFIAPQDDDDGEDDRLEWHDEREQTKSVDSEYLLDSSLYHLGAPRYFDVDIHLLAGNGTDLLSHSRSSKQIIFSGDTTAIPIVLQWYHGDIIQLAYFNASKSFVAVTDESDSNIYTIDVTHQSRLKIRLRTCLPEHRSRIVKDRLFLRTDECHLFVYYEREDGRKRLRLFSPTLECVRSYSIGYCLERAMPSLQGNTGSVVGLAINQTQIVLFVQSMAIDAQAAAVTQPMDRICLLVFSKSKMSFVDRVDLTHRSFPTPLVIHFASLSSFSIVDQSQSILRFFHREQETGQIQLQVSNIPLGSPRTTTSIVLMNDGSLLFSNNTKDITQLVLGDQANETSNWWF